MNALEGTLSSIMDLSVKPNTKIKEKRERQPNWTEAEKQLLLSLTRIHQVILEHKGSDTMTIKRKSEAWDDIANNMRAAGYQRSKERLKQQLGRIRATEAKKAKDALANELAQNNDLAALASSASDTPTTTLKQQSIESMPTPIKEIPIKIEKAISLEDLETACTEKPFNIDQKALSDTHLPSTPVSDIPDINKLNCNAPHLFNPNSLFMNEGIVRDTVDSEQQLPNDALYPNNNTNCKCDCVQKILGHVRFRIRGYSPRTHAQRIRQLHLYRVAVEKERLRMLRLQQKRDRIFYQKDKQIQNLKLEILRSLALNRINQINFT
ncbi:uncharacterized protein [Eurosta solidaginis]|uniref:uncharacterized protein n=1 Tax=Eurosta solidaginis TaxID=178769 RepID=UPI0035308F99